MGLPQQTGLKEEVVWYAGRATRVLVSARTVSVSRKPGAIPCKGHPNMQKKIGAGEEIRTLDPNLGKVVLYP